MSEKTDWRPQKKVTAGGVGGAIAVVLIFVVKKFGIDIGAEEASLLTTAAATLFAYFKNN